MKKPSPHQKRVLSRVEEKFGKGWFTVKACSGLALGRTDFTLWNMAKHGLLIKELNPDREKPDVIGWTSWRYRLPDKS